MFGTHENKPLLRTSATTLLLAGNGSRSATTPVPSQKAPMQSIEIGQPMELWTMDVLDPLLMTARGNQYILVMSDHFTKWVEAVPMPNQRAETVAKAFVNEVVTRHGVPSKLILTDQGRNFEADLMKQVFSLLGVRAKTKNFAVPSPNGRTSGENESHVEGNSDSLCKKGP